MKVINKIMFSFIFLILCFASSYGEWTMWDCFESHKWIGEGWGGEAPHVDWAYYQGNKAIQVQFNGTANYGFWRTEHFKDENWKDVTAIKADVFLITNNKKSVASKLEAKNHIEKTIEQLWSQALPVNQWVTVTWKTSPDKDYSVVSQLVMNLEGFLGSPATIYISNVRLVKNNMDEVWDTFDLKPHFWGYGGSPKTWWSIGSYEVITHALASPLTPVGSGYLNWDYQGKDSWAEIVAPINENWSGYNQVRYDVYCTDTAAPLSVYLHDGKTGYEPTPQYVTQANTWQTLTFNLEFPKDFNSINVKEFKCVTIELQKHPTGEAYFDNIQVFKK